MIEDLIDLEILKYYSKLFKQDPVRKFDCSALVKEFDISPKELLGHIVYLNQLNLLDCSIISDGAHCKISAMGIDAIQHPDQYESNKPIYNIVVQGNVVDSIIAQGSNLNIINSFNHIFEEIKDSGLDVKIKNELSEDVQEIKDELEKQNPRLGKIKSILIKFKEKSPDKIYSLLISAIFKCLEHYLNAQ